MMLTPHDLLLIVATSAACTLSVAVLVLVALRTGRTKTIAVQIAALVTGAIAAIVASTLVIASEMYLSEHDMQVLLWVIGSSALLSLAVTLATARLLRRFLRAVQASVAQVGAGGIVDLPDSAGAREIEDLSAQLAEASRLLAEARERIDQLDASSRQFFAWISHDLRTPLTGVSALAEALEAGEVEDPGSYLRQIRAQTTTLNRLVTDLFSLSQLHTGTLRLCMADLALLDLVSDAVTDVTPLAEARNIRITPVGVEGHTLHSDPHELTRVIVNLLTNSIRYAPRARRL